MNAFIEAPIICECGHRRTQHPLFSDVAHSCSQCSCPQFKLLAVEPVEPPDPCEVCGGWATLSCDECGRDANPQPPDGQEATTQTERTEP